MNNNSFDIRIAKSTEYFKLLEDSNETIGVSHHSAGLGKMKVFDKNSEVEYGVPISDIMNKPLKDWRIDRE